MSESNAAPDDAAGHVARIFSCRNYEPGRMQVTRRKKNTPVTAGVSGRRLLNGTIL